MPSFLTRQDLYKILQRELPDNVYPQGPPSGFFSTAENDSVAQVVATAYENLQRVYENYFPATADENLPKWEVAVFGQELDTAENTLAQRRDKVLQKIRSRKGITRQDIKDIVLSIIGSDKDVYIAEHNCYTGAWELNVSELNFTTYLNGWYGGFPNLKGPDICEKTAAEMGLTEEELLSYRFQAYAYDVIITNYSPTVNEARAIDLALKFGEPARSDHRIISSDLIITEDGDILTTEDGDVIIL